MLVCTLLHTLVSPLRERGLTGVGIRTFHPHPNPLPEGEGACHVVCTLLHTPVSLLRVVDAPQRKRARVRVKSPPTKLIQTQSSGVSLHVDLNPAIII